MTKEELLQSFDDTLPANNKIYTQTGVVRNLMNSAAEYVDGIKSGLFPEISGGIAPEEGTAGYRGIAERVYGFLGYYNNTDQSVTKSIAAIYRANGQQIPGRQIEIPAGSWGYFDMINNTFYDETGPFEIPYIEDILHESFYLEKSNWAIFGFNSEGERVMIFDNLVDARIENNFKRVQLDFETFNIPYPLWTVARRL
jgi:hypothetical protein